MERISLPIACTEFGFERTTCECELCSFWCKIMPGFLVPSDLQRLCPPGADLMTWARVHLRASQGFRLVNPMTGAMLQIPSLVPAKHADGHCHWLQPDGHCAVHEKSPFGCAYVDQHMKEKVVEKRNYAGRLARMEDFDNNGPYSRIWRMLMAEGLTGGGEHEAAMRELRRIEAKLAKRAENQARKDRRKERKRRKSR